jgi:hypothetical protein
MVDGLNTSTFSPAKLIAGEFDRATRDITLTGGAALLAGAVLGRSVAAGATVGAAAVRATRAPGDRRGRRGRGAQIGVYRAVCVEPGANVGTFVVFDPPGVEIGRVIVGGAAFNNQIGFTIADGATDFVAGDAFTISVAAGAEKFKLSAAAAVDGSQEPCAILAQDTDPSGGRRRRRST